MDLQVNVFSSGRLVQVKAWCRTGDKSSSDPKMTQVIDVYVRQPASVRPSVWRLHISHDFIAQRTSNAKLSLLSRWKTDFKRLTKQQNSTLYSWCHANGSLCFDLFAGQWNWHLHVFYKERVCEDKVLHLKSLGNTWRPESFYLSNVK